MFNQQDFFFFFFRLLCKSLFWGVLIWKRKAEEALLASGLPYTVRSFSVSVLEGKQSNALLFLDQLRLLFSFLFR